MHNVAYKYDIVGFEQNRFLKGMEHFDILFNAIQNKVVLEVAYQCFKYDTPQNTSSILISSNWTGRLLNKTDFLSLFC